MQLVFLDRDTTDADDIDLGALEALGDLRSHGLTSPGETADRIADADIVLTNKVVIGPAEMDASEKLRLIQVVATGVNNIDLDAARERSIAVCNVPGYSTPAVTQHVFACLLNLASNVHRYAAEPEKWAQSPHFTRLDYPVAELSGKRLGIAGLGAIGSEVARLGQAFGMEVVALARPGSASPSGSGPNAIPRVQHEEFFASCDAISLHCPLTPDTEHLIDRDTLAAMKPTAFLINTGRGGLVNEPDLLDALRNGAIAAAAVDVISREPPGPDHPMVADPPANLFLTPHTAWSSREARQRLVDEIASNLEAFREGKDRNRVA